MKDPQPNPQNTPNRPGRPGVLAVAPGGVGSLTTWVQRHMVGSETSGLEPSNPVATLLPSALATATGSGVPPVEGGQAIGQRLNATDYELSSGLEQLLPTPAIRYGVIKKRLERQIAELRQRIADIEVALAPDDVSGWVAPLRKRLALLQRHEVMVDRQIQYLLSQQTSGFAAGLEVVQATDRAKQWLAHAIEQGSQWAQHGMNWVVPPKEVDVARRGYNRQLQAVLALMQALDKGQPLTGKSDDGLRTRLFNQYEACVAKLSALPGGRR
jgi:hypothetical protein